VVLLGGSHGDFRFVATVIEPWFIASHFLIPNLARDPVRVPVAN